MQYEHEDRNLAGDCVYRLQRHFVDSMESGAPFESNGHDYLEMLRVVEGIYESASTGQPIAV